MDQLVSIVISLFNKEAFVLQAVRSALAQSYKNIEVIVVDDGSTDSSVQRLQQVRDHRLTIVNLSSDGTNLGLVACKNRGCELAKGEFVAFLDADDMWAESKVKTHVQALNADPAACLAYSLTAWIDANGHEIGAEDRYQPPLDFYSTLLLSGNLLGSGSNAVHRRTMLPEPDCFDRSLESATDWDLYLRLARHHSFSLVAEPLVLYRISDNQHSLDVAKMERSVLRIADREYGETPASLFPKKHRQRCLRNSYNYLLNQCIRNLRNPATPNCRHRETMAVLAHCQAHCFNPFKLFHAFTAAGAAFVQSKTLHERL